MLLDRAAPPEPESGPPLAGHGRVGGRGDEPHRLDPGHPVAADEDAGVVTRCLGIGDRDPLALVHLPTGGEARLIPDKFLVVIGGDFGLRTSSRPEADFVEPSLGAVVGGASQFQRRRACAHRAREPGCGLHQHAVAEDAALAAVTDEGEVMPGAVRDLAGGVIGVVAGERVGAKNKHAVTRRFLDRVLEAVGCGLVQHANLALRILYPEPELNREDIARRERCMARHPDILRPAAELKTTAETSQPRLRILVGPAVAEGQCAALQRVMKEGIHRRLLARRHLPADLERAHAGREPAARLGRAGVHLRADGVRPRLFPVAGHKVGRGKRCGPLREGPRCHRVIFPLPSA